MNIDTLVSTTHGKIRGYIENGLGVWKGVPYAKAPIGSLRFKSPEPMDIWQDTKDATNYAPSSPQLKLDNPIGDISEDCLYLNIWSPGTDGSKRPVLFWIHGGAYISGSGSITAYDGSVLAKNGEVVVVTINYRLGPFGFLYTKDLPDGDLIDTNVGHRDQLMALNWVRENIASFGGDPENITIFGESAGGASVVNLLGSPLAKGLFHKAIVESPCSYHIVYSDKAKATLITRRFLELLGIQDYSAKQLLDVSTEDIVKAAIKLVDEIALSHPGTIAFQPLIGDDLLPESAHTAIKNGSGSHVPLIIGSNQDEGTVFAGMPAPVMPVQDKQMELFLENAYPDTSASIKEAYSTIPASLRSVKMGGDAIIWHSVTTIADAMQSKCPTYLYRFKWSSDYLKAAGLGSFHSLEIPFVFGTLDATDSKPMLEAADRNEVEKLSTIIQDCWLNFARTGNPNSGEGFHWKKYDSTGRFAIVFDKEIGFEHDTEARYRKAWQER